MSWSIEEHVEAWASRRQGRVIATACVLYVAAAAAWVLALPSPDFWHLSRAEVAVASVICVGGIGAFSAWRLRAMAAAVEMARLRADQGEKRELRLRSEHLVVESLTWLALALRQKLGVPMETVDVTLWKAPEEGGTLLQRVARAGIGPHLSSGVAWTRGKGVVGHSWETGDEMIIDLGPLHRLSRAEFEAIEPASRLRLNWSEFQRIGSYDSIWAIPIREDERVLGILSIGIAHPGAYQGLVDTVNDGLVSGLLGAAEPYCIDLLGANLLDPEPRANARRPIREVVAAGTDDWHPAPPRKGRQPSGDAKTIPRIAYVTDEAVDLRRFVVKPRGSTRGVTPEAAAFIRGVEEDGQASDFGDTDDINDPN